ncbi:serine/threonine-protein kinase [Amycolatopsis xylanica]|uniref:serine/threonine-protein kinase n=1 Tax=Amycolatopsis xylanica TaxID=589385 RepID=UPI00115FEAB8|nr:serine/threonine-protein kinase [Amycolatopsis xylanica]
MTGFTELEALGEGAFGKVVLARHDVTGQFVAIKYLTRMDGLADFRREAETLRHVDNPHIARLYEFVEDGTNAAIIMELVRGISLQRLLAEQGTLAPEAALAVLKGSLLGLAGAHAAGVVHRDYKPGNVLVGADGQSKLVDFGIAVLTGQGGDLIGTPAYMAPEQWRGDRATPSTDVYAATCVFFRCVTGRHPYTEDLREAHQRAPIPVADVPEPVRGLVVRGMAKEALLRPADAAKFAAELEKAAKAGYGRDWEAKGWRALGAGAAALVPSLLTLGVAGSALAPAIGGVTAGAGVAGGSVGGIGGVGGGVGGLTIGAKIAIGVGALVTAAVATVVVVLSTGGEDKEAQLSTTQTSTPLALNVSLQERSEQFTDPKFAFRGQYPVVTGIADPAVAKKINDALAAPLEGRKQEVRDVLNGLGPDFLSGYPETPTTITKTEVVQGGPKLITVRYEHSAEGQILGHASWRSADMVTVDLTTGRQLNAQDILKPSTMTADGLRALITKVRAADSNQFCGEDLIRYPLTPDIFARYGHREAVKMAASPGGLTFVVFTPAIGTYAEACGEKTIVLPYEKIKEFLRPEFLALI